MLSRVGRWKALTLASAAYGPRAALTAARAGASQKIREFAGLVKLVREQRPDTVLEIGTYRGGSLWAWCRVASPNAAIISVDLPGGAFGGGYDETEIGRLQAYARPSQELHLIRADSHSPDTLAEVTRLLAGRPVDFAFIDGDHTYEGVQADFSMYSRLVRPGGLIALHDIVPGPDDAVGGVPRFWAELKRVADVQEIVADWRQGGYGIGLIQARALTRRGDDGRPRSGPVRRSPL
jgi:predicted O-methyltransferase YrrM